jgi:hypothetical protein
VHHGRFNARETEGLGHLQTDEAGADDDGPPAGSLLDKLLDADGVAQALEDKDTLALLSGHSRRKGPCAGAEDKKIIREPVPVFQKHRLLPDVHGLHPGFREYLDPRFPELLRRPGYQFPIVLDYITDVIRHRSGGGGCIGCPLDDCNGQVRISPPGFRRRGGTTGAPSHDHEIFPHFPPLSLNRSQVPVSHPVHGAGGIGRFGEPVSRETAGISLFCTAP